MEDSKIRINKFLSEAGVCSRRQADQYILAKEVRINGRIAEIGDTVASHDKVLFQGKLVQKEQKLVLLVVNKPVGIICTSQEKEKNNIVDYLHYPQRIYSIGRLDKDSQGLLLMTNNGDIVNKIMRAGNSHEKEYVVTVDKEVSDAFIKGMSGGVRLKELNTTTRRCFVEKTGKHEFRIILTQGLNRQIRRMCETLGYHVTKLNRIRIMNIKLDNLKLGAYREITKKEFEDLNKLIANSSNEPYAQRIEKKESNQFRSETDGYRKKNQRVKRNHHISQ